MRYLRFTTFRRAASLIACGLRCASRNCLGDVVGQGPSAPHHTSPHGGFENASRSSASDLLAARIDTYLQLAGSLTLLEVPGHLHTGNSYLIAFPCFWVGPVWLQFLHEYRDPQVCRLDWPPTANDRRLPRRRRPLPQATAQPRSSARPSPPGTSESRPRLPPLRSRHQRPAGTWRSGQSPKKNYDYSCHPDRWGVGDGGETLTVCHRVDALCTTYGVRRRR